MNTSGTQGPISQDGDSVSLPTLKDGFIESIPLPEKQTDGKCLGEDTHEKGACPEMFSHAPAKGEKCAVCNHFVGQHSSLGRKKCFVDECECLCFEKPTPQPSEAWENQKAREVVDEFLGILEPWFHPNKDWDRITNSANEFLFESVVRVLSLARAEAKKEERQEACHWFEANGVNLPVGKMPPAAIEAVCFAIKNRGQRFSLQDPQA